MRKHLAYLLSKVSIDIFGYFGMSIGLIEIPMSNMSEGRWAPQAVRSSDDGSHGSEDEKPWPDFVPVAASSEIERGARSLSLLYATNPDHPLCHPDPSWSALCSGWCWTNDDVEQRIAFLEEHVRNIKNRIDGWRWNLTQSRRGVDHGTNSAFTDDVTPFDDVLYPSCRGAEAVATPDFTVFDLEPGTHTSGSAGAKVDTPAKLNYAQFDNTYPAGMPAAAPTLQTLLDVAVLQPLSTHARILSSSLLEVFLSDLDFVGHLDLLRRFMLFGDPSFAMRVRMALFTDSGNPGEAINSSNRARDRRQSSAGGLERYNVTTKGHGGRGWGVGLNPSLSDAGAWPPAGSDLAFTLRRVIVDTLDDGRFEAEDGERRTGHGKQRDEIWNQAEWRLGFIIKSFDDEDGEDEPAWADPFCEYLYGGAPPGIKRFIFPLSFSNSCIGFPRDGL